MDGQAKLRVNRDKDVDAILGKPAGSSEAKAEATTTTANTDVTMAPADDEEAAALQAALAMSLASADAPPPVPATPVGPGLPLDFKGNYELFGVVTHKGEPMRAVQRSHIIGIHPISQPTGLSLTRNAVPPLTVIRPLCGRRALHGLGPSEGRRLAGLR